MVENKEIKLLLKGLNCANCANKIEARVADFKEVEEAQLNFTKSILYIKVKESESLSLVTEMATKLINQLEPHVQVLNLDDEEEEEIKPLKRCCEGSCSEEHYHHNHSHNESGQSDVLKKKNSDTKGGIAKFLGDNWSLMVGIIVYGLAMITKDKEILSVMLFIVSYIFVGKGVLLTSFRNIVRGEVFDENFLMSIATLGAMAIGEYPEGIAVMVFYEIGEIFQGYAVDKSRGSISELMNIRPDYANLIVGGKEETVSPKAVKVEDLIVVKAGERVPLDGIIEEGNAYIDTAALTGESVPREVSIGDEILSGCINTNGLLKIRVKKVYGDSTVAKILELVENASNKKAKTEKLITRFARIYTPIVVFTAVAVSIIPPLFLGWNEFSTWLYRALIFLVVSCPCALVVSVPLGMFAGIGGASKKGVLVKGGNYLEALKDVRTVVFDKTGTLTKGFFKVTEISSIKVTKDELIEIAAIGESKSNHPIAQSIIKEYGKAIDDKFIEDYEEISGHGISLKIDNEHILLGNMKLMKKFKIKASNVSAVGTVVHVAKNGEYLGYIVISDEIKETSAQAIRELKDNGIKKVVMLTGDRREVAEAIGSKLGVDEIYYELLPDEKVDKLEMLLGEDKVAFVGDGINDAPVLARADVGIAMGGIGSDAAIEAADVVLMNDDPVAIVNALKTSIKTNKILWQNIIFALGIKLLVMVLGLFGFATMWVAVFADVGVTILAIINSTRCLR